MVPEIRKTSVLTSCKKPQTVNFFIAKGEFFEKRAFVGLSYKKEFVQIGLHATEIQYECAQM